MAMAEDAASVLEEFVNNVANLPAEITHLMEEIHAKDRVVQECRTAAAVRDSSIQKFLKTNGAGQVNPKEELYSKTILSNYEKAQAIQNEKVALSEKAGLLLDRQIKRLDLKIRDLQNEGSISIDPQLPSLLTNSSLHNTRLPPLSTSTSTGASTPLHPLSSNANPTGPSTTIAATSTSANPLTRLGVQPRQPSPLTTTAATATSSSVTATRPGTTRSPSTDPSKRRRLNPLHTHLSNAPIRQSSLGPGTPKASGTGGTSRGSSAGPRPASKNPLRKTGTGGPPHARIGSLNPAKKIQASGSSSRRRKHKAGKPHASDTGDENDSVMSGADGDDGDNLDDGGDAGGAANGNDGAGDDGGMEDAEGDDGRKYCTCRSVSYGNMVACDNEECPYEWFHWSCVGMTKEPVGAWFCAECRRRG